MAYSITWQWGSFASLPPCDFLLQQNSALPSLQALFQSWSNPDAIFPWCLSEVCYKNRLNWATFLLYFPSFCDLVLCLFFFFFLTVVATMTWQQQKLIFTENLLCIFLHCMCAQWCPTLCDPMDWGPPGSSIHGIFQARVLEWVGISCSRGSSRPKNWTHVYCISCAGRWIPYH